MTIVWQYHNVWCKCHKKCEEPTQTDDKFRETFDEALSYFFGGKIAEDHGFAIKPWSKARFGEQDILFNGDSAIAMGNYYFTPHGETKETKVEYTSGYVKDDEGNSG